MSKRQSKPATPDHLDDFAPIFRGEGSCVARGIYPREEVARFDWLVNKVALVEQGIAIKRGRTWYAHPERLKAFLLEVARKRARDALARERRPKPAVSLSVARGPA